MPEERILPGGVVWEGDEDDSPDYRLEGSGMWVRVGELSIHIYRPHGTSDVAVEVLKSGHEMCPSLGELCFTPDMGEAACPCGQDEGRDEDDEAGCNRLGDAEHERLRLALKRRGYDVPSGVVAGWATAYFRRADAWAAVGGPLPEELSAISYFARERGAR